MNPAVHPKLQKEIRLIRFILICTVLALGGILALDYFLEGGGQALFMGLVFLGVILLSVYMNGRTNRAIQRVSRLVFSTEPHPLIMRYIGLVDHTGTYVEFRRPDEFEVGTALAVASLETGRHKPIPRGETKVRVYRESGAEDRFVAIETKDRIYWGRLTSRESRAAVWKRFRWIYLALTLAGLALLGLLVLDQHREVLEYSEQARWARASLNWPRTPGTIQSSEVREVRISSGRIKVQGYEVRVLYRYSVGGKSHESLRIHFGYGPGRDESKARALAGRFSPGSEVDVVYDPVKPERAVLESGHVVESERALGKAKIARLVFFIGWWVILAVMIGIWVWLKWRWRKLKL